jgi:general secretion pathway protein J
MSRSQRGFTLLEMLVSLVIVAMVSTLVFQAMRQVARVEQVLEESGSAGQQRLVRREWLRGLLTAALPEQVNQPVQFKGTALEMSLMSNHRADGLGTVLTPMRLQIHQSDSQGRSELRLFTAPEDRLSLTEPKPPVVLFTWTGTAGKFSYQDDKGVWHAQWPVNSEASKRLPTLLRIDLGEEAGGLLLAAPASTEAPRVRLADWVD